MSSGVFAVIITIPATLAVFLLGFIVYFARGWRKRRGDSKAVVSEPKDCHVVADHTPNCPPPGRTAATNLVPETPLPIDANGTPIQEAASSNEPEPSPFSPDCVGTPSISRPSSYADNRHLS